MKYTFTFPPFLCFIVSCFHLTCSQLMVKGWTSCVVVSRRVVDSLSPCWITFTSHLLLWTQSYISNILALPRSVLGAVTVTTRPKSPHDFKPLPPLDHTTHPPTHLSVLSCFFSPSSLAAEVHHKLQPSANLRNSVNVDLYLWAVLKVYYN